MKTATRLFTALLLATLTLTLSAQEQQTARQAKNIETVKFEASMTCENCVKTIMDTLPKEKGVTDVRTDLGTKTVTVTYRKGRNDAAQLKRSLEKLGFTAKPLPTGNEKK